MPTRLLPLFVVLPLLLAFLGGRAADPPAPAHPRRPVALALADDGARLLVANRDAGTVSILDTRTLRVERETRVGERLADLHATPQGGLVAVADAQAGVVVLLRQRDGALKELRRLTVGAGPTTVRLAADGRLLSVARRWPRRVLLFTLPADLANEAPPAPAVLDLPFAPHGQLFLPGGKLVVTDAFAGAVAVIDPVRRRLESTRTLPVINMRGLALGRTGKDVLLTHQALSAQARPNAGDIRSGSLIANSLRRLPLAALLDPRADLDGACRVHPLGDVERGAGDPAGIAETTDGQAVVALAGVGELAIGRPEQVLWSRLSVGRRPTALVLDGATGRGYVAATFADTVAVADLRAGKILAEVRLGPETTRRPEERGEELFHDARLSFEGWFSCHSCHTDGHTNGRLNDNFTDGSFGTPKRVLTLLGTRDSGPWAWNGKMPALEAQIRQSVTSTMQGATPTAEQVRDLAAYLRTLAPPPALLRERGAFDAAAFARGRKVFRREKCATCHTPPSFTSAKAYDVHIHDEIGGTHFNPPSLRGVSQGGPYFHDGRASTLAEVFTRQRHQLAAPLTESELRDLLHYLGGL